MSEKDLGDALLRGQEYIDSQALTEHVLRRDRRRIWVLGIACVIAWMAVVMLPWSTILPMLAKIGQQQFDLSRTPPSDAREQQAQMLEMARTMKTGIVATFFFSIASMFVAALCTVLLIIVSRRATLRQVNARLREISLQIKNLSAPR